MRLALVQFRADLKPARNLVGLGAMLDQIVPGSCDLVVLPEAAMADFGRDDHDVTAVSESLDGPFAAFLSAHARRLSATIVAGMFERHDTRPFNTLLAVGPDGSLLARYRKIHLYDSFGHRESERFTAGAIEPVVVPVAGRRVGLLTCYDLRFPELARALAYAGADLLVVPAAWLAGEHKLAHWTTLLQARAVENVCQAVGVGQTGPIYTAHSLAVDPWGTIVVDAGPDAGVTIVDLADEQVEHARRANPSLSNRRMGLP